MGSENGRKAGESSESSSAEERGPRVAFWEEKRGRRVNARLLVRRGAASEADDDEELGLSLGMAGGEVGGEGGFCLGFTEVCVALRDAGGGRGWDDSPTMLCCVVGRSCLCAS